MQLHSLLPPIILIPSNMANQSSTRIQSNAARDSIDLTTLPFYSEALDSITALSTTPTNPSSLDFTTATKIDTHTHPIPAWYHALEPLAAGRATPTWNVSSHLEFMSSRGIARSILSVSTPQGNVFLHDDMDTNVRRKKTVALARLLNEYVGEVARLFPQRFSFLAVVPLPYADEAITEARYALEELGTIGIAVLTNHEGMYPGDTAFDPLWTYLNSREGGKEVVFIHPTEPVIKLEDGRFVDSRPCKFTTPSLHLSFQKKHRITMWDADKLTSTTTFRSRRILLRHRARDI
jgi:hypothetical protein